MVAEASERALLQRSSSGSFIAEVNLTIPDILSQRFQVLNGCLKQNSRSQSSGIANFDISGGFQFQKQVNQLDRSPMVPSRKVYDGFKIKRTWMQFPVLSNDPEPLWFQYLLSIWLINIPSFSFLKIQYCFILHRHVNQVVVDFVDNAQEFESVPYIITI